MRIVADENIPEIQHYLGDQAEVLLKPGRLIVRDDLLDADVLLTRSTTRVDSSLLNDTSVRFVGSTVAGLDHLDIEYLNAENIPWYAAEGCNAESVAEYVVCCVAALQRKDLLQKDNLRAAVIGVGRVGSLVVKKLKTLGFEVIECDPFYNLTPIEEISDVDLICLHTPLTKSGEFPTYHLIDKTFLERQKKGAVLLSAGRGAVIDFSHLKKYGRHLHWCLDVFENEPNIDLDILQETLIATPHIAGHSIQAKLRGLEMVYHEMLKKKLVSREKIFSYPKKIISFGGVKAAWRDVALKVYDPFETSEQMKKGLLSDTSSFDALRKGFSKRSEFQFVEVEDFFLDEENRWLLNEISLL